MANSIDLIGRLLCVADVFDALTSARSYRGALSRSDATQMIEKESGPSETRQLHPARAEG
jgi:HD-GYP domain-containing protein (c-di-GMP phosphodiesterase class II)